MNYISLYDYTNIQYVMLERDGQDFYIVSLARNKFF
jgi:hypothetical protein